MLDLAENIELTEDERAEAELRRAELVQVFGNDLQKLADEQVSLKAELEKRWIDDLRHYNNKYDKETEAKLSNAKGKTSTIFVGITRSRTNLAEAKLSDLILPTDDKNWGIGPTPVPSLAKMEGNQDPVQLADGRTATKEDGTPYTYADLVRVNREEARKKCDLMQQEIDDQLTEGRYHAVGRDIIHDACVLGTGILKGPMVTKRERRSWAQIQGSNAYQMVFEYEHRPLFGRVDPWNFFPDMSATCWDDVEFVFERHLLTKKKVRDLMKRPGFMKVELQNLLREDPRSHRGNLSYINELREINGISNIREDSRYEIWEYHGPVKKEYLLACGCKGIDMDDPLEEYEGVVWFANGRVLKVGLNHMDDDSLPYSVFCWEKDETSVFGFGVPYRMRGSQKVMNGSWRMLLDNAGLSTGPQIIVNRKVVEPADGNWELQPRKLWYLTSEKHNVQDAFATFEINSHQAELAAIFEMALSLADQETNVPQLGNQMNAENQPAVMKTLGGTALWMSSQNIQMRRAVKNWDDDITVPFITRMYNWNMQFSGKDDIKGDYEVDARGSSVLLVREIQARNMMDFLTIANSNPETAGLVKGRAMLKIVAKSMQIPEDEVIKSEDDVAQEQQNQQPAPDPEQIRQETQLKIAEMNLQEKQIEMESMRQAKLIDREIALTKIAAEQNKTLAQIQKDFDLGSIKVDWDRERFYREIGIKAAEGITANYGLGE